MPLAKDDSVRLGSGETARDTDQKQDCGQQAPEAKHGAAIIRPEAANHPGGRNSFILNQASSCSLLTTTLLRFAVEFWTLTKESAYILQSRRTRYFSSFLTTGFFLDFLDFRRKTMRSSIRVFAVAVLAFFMMSVAFADDAASPAKKPADTAAAPGTADTSPATPQPATPTPAPAPPASSSSFRGDNTPLVEVFGGFSYIRTNLQGGPSPPPPPPILPPSNTPHQPLTPTH